MISRKCDEQFSLTVPSIKNKLLQMAKEFREEFKFQQSLRIEFTVNDEFFKNKMLADPWFDSEKIEFSDINIDELLNREHIQRSSRVERLAHEGSGWTFHSILQHQFVISEVTPIEESSYFLLPKELRNPLKELINIQNKDNECFRWLLVRPARIGNVVKEFANQLSFKGVKFSVHKKDYVKVEEKHISISVSVRVYCHYRILKISIMF